MKALLTTLRFQFNSNWYVCYSSERYLGNIPFEDANPRCNSGVIACDGGEEACQLAPKESLNVQLNYALGGMSPGEKIYIVADDRGEASAGDAIEINENNDLFVYQL